MNRFFLIGICIFSQIFFQSVCFGKKTLETIVYVLHQNNQEALKTISQNANVIDMIIAQSYHIDRNGIVTGALDAKVIELSRKKSIKLLAMITNSSFDKKSVHLFLSNARAKTKAIATLLTLCQQNHLNGIQFDFEMVALADRKLLSDFYEAAANALHRDGYMISFAVGPTLEDDHFSSAYQQKLYEVWEGAYDLKPLGKISNFITLMAYDQHGEGTIPGPIASRPWSEAAIQHALKFIPKEKLFLGIPVYSGFWYMSALGKKITTVYSQLDHNTLNYMRDKFHPVIYWDKIGKVNYTFFEYHGLNKFIFIENKQSFQEKLQLAKKYHLQGIAIFRLGIEDPALWKVIK